MKVTQKIVEISTHLADSGFVCYDALRFNRAQIRLDDRIFSTPYSPI